MPELTLDPTGSAAAAAAGQGGKELQLCYRDDGGDQVWASWAVRVQE